MDFNPLDLLAAAALSNKESSSESKGSDGSDTNQESNSESAESKDADDNSDNMGKTKSNSLKQPVKLNDLKVSCDMSPQKISWSPDSFLSCLDKPSLEHEKLVVEQLSPEFVKEIVKCTKTTPVKIESYETKELYCKYDSPQEDNTSLFKNVKVEDTLDVKDGSINGNNGKGRGPEPVTIKTEPIEGAQDVKLSKDVKAQDVKLSKDVKVEVKVEELETGSQSDTDTADTTDSKIPVDDLSEMSCQEIVSIDHPYCLIPGQLLRMPSVDMLDEDIDVCSDSSPLTEDTEQRSRNFSLDCNYLKSGILEGKSVGTPQLHRFTDKAHTNHKLESPHKPSQCEPTLRLPKGGDSSAFKQVSVLSPERPGPSYGKFKIGTFASFSSSNLELEKYLRGLDSPSDRTLDSENDRSSKGFHSPVYSPSVQPLLQSPTLDWDRSEAGSETHDDSSDARTPHRLSPDFTTERVQEWTHPMYHDHDYCAKTLQKPVADDIVKLPLAKRKYTKRKNKLDSVNHEKIMKAKYLKKELLKDSFIKSTPNPLPEAPVTAVDPGMKANPVGRPRKRPLEKTIEEEIDPETGAKMKITGKFQDQYVYYLSKSKSTSRRRQTPTLPLLSDKIIVPAPKPGDIFVPHLTDADIEIVRTKGRGALNIPERPHMPSVLPLPSKCSIPNSLPVSQANEFMSDVDSHIVSTILSMESDNLASPSSSQSQDLSQNSDIYTNQAPISDESNITSEEQVLNYLLSVVKEEEPSLLQSTSSLFPPLPSDPMYSKAGQFSETEIGTHGPNGLNNKLECVNSEILSSSVPLENHVFGNSVVKSETEESGSLPDDFSSFISPSQITNTSISSQECNSQSSLKSEYSSDLSPPSLTPSALRLTSIEKTLDYLGVKDGEIKLEHNHFDTSNKICPNDISNQLIIPNSTLPVPADDDTPWIVTVTLYFNDVPAIMIINEPYIRLVDIHKQILPAKDTGILKKRCQLLNIPVLNCTEMHRYFLVQYGKAYNSKSTLIISKDQATELVRYYATPQPRLGRAEEVNVRRPSCGMSSDGGNMSPHSAEAPSTGPVKKRGCNKNRKGAQTSGLTLPESTVAEKTLEVDPVPASDGMNKRTRHKKVNYLEMLKGEEREKPDDSILQAIESVVKTTSDQTVCNSKLSKEKYSVTNSSRSKKKISKTQNLDKKIKEKTNHRRKSVDSKKGKNSGKLLKTSKTKGSTSKHGKKHDNKLVRKEDETCPVIETECGEDLAYKYNKFKPLKLKVNSLLNFTSQRRQSQTSPSSSSLTPSKKGLFSRSNSTSSAVLERPMRVLAVAHQAALSNEDGDTHLPSQPADIHLDLFTRSSSACVRCHTCSQFLSVPHFMRHHHVEMDNEWLATEAAHRILVPRNKENISEEERKLWEEFHRLQESIGGFGEADDDSNSDDESDDSDFDGPEEQSSLETSGASFISMDASHDQIDLSSESSCVTPSSALITNKPHVCGDNHNSHHLKSTMHVTPHDNLTTNISGRESEFYYKSQLGSVSSAPSNTGVLKNCHDSTSNVRMSSRRRKSKQLFSIENYCTPTIRKSTDEDTSCINTSISGAGGV